jgi:hypothetical protein
MFGIKKVSAELAQSYCSWRSLWRWTLPGKLHNTRAETVSPIQGSAPVISDIVGDPGKCTNAWRALSVEMTSMIAQLPVTVGARGKRSLQKGRKK